uniref:Uncharacterized protein n=1 Tax=Glossina morsitans morsitans TaxID=37546 RepID=A0ABK9NFT6_GLOMM
MNILNPLL